jgi:glycerophosphoryl diester phosphodiesterase
VRKLLNTRWPSRFAATTVAAGVLLIAGSCASPHPGVDHRWIAHALGGYQGKSYLNCRECFGANYSRGYQLFEMDFVMTSDGHLAGIHDGQEKEFGLPNPFTLAQFKVSSISGTTPLADTDVAELARTHDRFYLVTDIKSDNLNGLRQLCRAYESSGVPCADRVIPQIYGPAEMPIVDEIGFKRVIFTLYRYGNRREEVLAFLDRNPKIWAVTMWADWWDAAYAGELRKRGVLGFVHTVNDRQKADRLFAEGVSGIYTDFLGGSQN